MKDQSFTFDKEYEETLKKNKLVKHSVNGLSRFLILWIIKHKKNIHGYGIVKELDKFFIELIADGSLKKSNPSKIYPILKRMEEAHVIMGEWKMNEKQKVKYYSLTEKGESLVNYFGQKIRSVFQNEYWQLLLEDIL